MKKNSKKKSLRSIVKDQPNITMDPNTARKVLGGYDPWATIILG